MEISKMTKRELREYVDFLLRQYRIVDAFWFLAVEDEFGLDTAVRFNEEIWARIGSLAAKEMKERFGIKAQGIPAVIEAVSYFPWTLITGYEIEQSEDRAVVRVPHCPPQAARLRQGRGEFPCKAMHLAEFTNIVKVIDEKVEVHCVIAPPDPHPDELWCQWEFRLKQDS
ncbi:MAG: DUF6125 family protein [Anaerolineae bacterium]